MSRLRMLLVVAVLLLARQVSSLGQSKLPEYCPHLSCPVFGTRIEPEGPLFGETNELLEARLVITNLEQGCYGNSKFNYSGYTVTWEVLGVDAIPQNGSGRIARFRPQEWGPGILRFHVKAHRIQFSRRKLCEEERTVDKPFHVLKIDLAMDGNRDGEIDFDAPEDSRYLFWVNDDHDQRHYVQTELFWAEDDLEGSPDCDNDSIGFNSGIGASCRRDLEDFTRVHMRVDGYTAANQGITYWVQYVGAGSSDPAANLFEAVSPGTAYLTDGSAADAQIQKSRLFTVSKQAPVQLNSRYIKGGGMISPFLLEGKRPGSGYFVFMARYNGVEVARREIYLRLEEMPWFYDEYKATAMGDRWESSVSQTAAQRTPVAGYSPVTDEKFLLVHGWNMTDWEKTRWVETTFKRLWWQGYQGSVSLFNWPTLADFGFWDIASGGRHFDNSEFRAWLSSEALVGVFNNLNTGGKLRVLAHSMGNVVVGGALRQYSGTDLHTYLACQAALSGHYYDNTLPSVLSLVDTPNIIGHFPNGADDPPYLAENATKAVTRINYLNEDDWALDLWESNNALKPDNVTPYFFWYDGGVDEYAEGVDRFVRGLVGDIWMVYTTNTARDRALILAYLVESRSKALGQAPVAIRQFGSWDLKSEMLYDDSHYSHSKEFRSTISEQEKFWERVMKDCSFSSAIPPP